MLTIIITTIAKINSTDEGNFLIYNNTFFMMRPKSWDDIRWMSQNFDVAMKSRQSFLSVGGVIRNDRRVFECQNENLNSFSSNRFQ